jgi:ribonuclease-3
VTNEIFQSSIGYNFKDTTLLEKALTHSSYTREHYLGRECCNERLEFLGDAFFDAIIGEELFRRLPAEEEGMLTKYRAAVVCARSLASEGRKLNIGPIIKLGHGEDASGGRDRDSIIADAMEAVIGAVFLDGGYASAKATVLALFGDTILDALAGRLHSDYKTEFQEKVQADGPADISYVLEKETGPDHEKTFFVSLSVNGEIRGEGKGKTKKEAEQNAAKDALTEESD